MKKISVYLTLLLLMLFATSVSGQSASQFLDNIIGPCEEIQESFEEYLDIEEYTYSELKTIVKNAIIDIDETKVSNSGTALKYAAQQFAKAAMKVIGKNEDVLLTNLVEETYDFDQFIEKEEELIRQQAWFARMNDIELY